MYTNTGAGRWAYLTIAPHAKTLDTTYQLTTASAKPKPAPKAKA